MEAFAVLQPTASSSSSSSSYSSSLVSSSWRPAAGREAAAAAAEEEEREHMFDKVVTPSDVGKLNRLVIPKQCAERFFPLDREASADKGLVLGFEDAGGRQWSFRYSYWHSSQSYVMTKGWSRFVKEKQLRAGDTVSFSRTAAAADDQCARRRLFIDLLRCRHRYPLLIPFSAAGDAQRPQTVLSRGGPSIARPTRQSVFLRQYHGVVQELTEGRAVLVGGGDSNNMALDSVPLVTGGGAAKAKRVRLFGVNLECPAKDEEGRRR